MGRAADIAIRDGRFGSSVERILARTRLGVPRSVVSVADQAVASVTTFATGALIGRTCSKEEFGYYTIAFALLTLLMTIQTSIISTPFMVRIPRLRDRESRVFSGSSLIHQLAFASGAAVAVALAGLLAVRSGAPLGPVLAALGFALTFLLLRDYVRQNCFARLEYGKALLLDALLAAFQFIALAALYATHRLHAWSAFAVLGVSSAVTAAHWYMTSRPAIEFDWRSVLTVFFDNWASGKWLLASGLMWALSMNLYAWIVAGFHGAAMAGTWAAALGVMTLINPLMLGAQNYIGPRIMHARAEGVEALRRVVRNAACAFCGMLLLFAIAMVFAGDCLVTTIYGTKYAGNGMLVVLFSLNAAVLTVGFAVSRGLFAIDHAHTDFYVNALALASFLLFGIPLVRANGPLGAAVAQLVTNVLATALRARVFVRAGRRLTGMHA